MAYKAVYPLMICKINSALNTGWYPAAFRAFDIRRKASSVLEQDDLLIVPECLIDSRKGEIEEERDCEGVTSVVVFEDAETLYVGLSGGYVEKFVEERESDVHALSAADRERQKHDHNSTTFGRSRAWEGFDGAVTAIMAGPRDKKLFASDSSGCLYEIWINESDRNEHDIPGAN